MQVTRQDQHVIMARIGERIHIAEVAHPTWSRRKSGLTFSAILVSGGCDWAIAPRKVPLAFRRAARRHFMALDKLA